MDHPFDLQGFFYQSHRWIWSPPELLSWEDTINVPRRAQRYIAGCEIEILPNADHVMSVDEPNVVGTRIVRFLNDPKPNGLP